MRIFRPHTLKDLLHAVASEAPPRYYIAGGTDLLVQKLDGILPPGTWFDLTAIPEMRGIDKQAGDLRIGSTTTYTEMIHSPLVREFAPALWKACTLVGGPQIRNRGTLGGNLGNASPAGDTLPPLYSVEAEVMLASEQGQRTLPIHEFFTGPRQTALRPDEVILAVRFPLRQALQGTFLRLGQRQAQTISKVSIAISALFHEGRFDYLRIALGAVAPTVVYASQTESILKNGKLDAQKIEAAKRAIVQEVQPISDIRSTAEYRRAMCPVLLDKALEELGMK